MKKTKGKLFGIAGILLAAFALWTLAVQHIDVQAIGPNGSSVGFAGLNGWVHDLTGVHMGLYVLTDWLGLVPMGFVLGFAVLGLVQWMRRRKLFRVDHDILLLGGFYLLVLILYLVFETVAVNARPVLIDGRLEASYPSSTTMLVLCVMPTAMMQLRARIRNTKVRTIVLTILAVFTVCMVVGRLIAGVHWFTDIIGGVLLSAGLVALYDAIEKKMK
ncbi:MAG: phosphatase PAP2 family protein [Eubacteriales bacterium]|nr:phosphatase PAP2 family protein [Eubacteriales bacterium]